MSLLIPPDSIPASEGNAGAAGENNATVEPGFTDMERLERRLMEQMSRGITGSTMHNLLTRCGGGRFFMPNERADGAWGVCFAIHPETIFVSPSHSRLRDFLREVAEHPERYVNRRTLLVVAWSSFQILGEAAQVDEPQTERMHSSNNSVIQAQNADRLMLERILSAPDNTAAPRVNGDLADPYMVSFGASRLSTTEIASRREAVTGRLDSLLSLDEEDARAQRWGSSYNSQSVSNTQ